MCEGVVDYDYLGHLSCGGVLLVTGSEFLYILRGQGVLNFLSLENEVFSYSVLLLHLEVEKEG